MGDEGASVSTFVGVGSRESSLLVLMLEIMLGGHAAVFAELRSIAAGDI